MPARLSEAELAARSATTPERVRLLVDLGVVEPGSDGTFRPIDIVRIRIASAFERSGLALEDLGRLVRERHVTFPNLEVTFKEPVPASSTTLRDLAESTGYDASVVAAVFGQLGLPEPAEDAPLREDDAAVLRDLLGTYDLRFAGVGDELVLRAARIYGENVRRLVKALGDLVRSTSPPPGELDSDERNRLRSTGGNMLRVGEETAKWLHRRHAEAAVVGQIVENIESVMESTGIGRRRIPEPPAIAFLDLSGFTRVTGERGDEEAARLAMRLSDVVDAVARRNGGRTVKLLGDGVMFHFNSPPAAVVAALDLVEATPGEGLPPARVGINAGPVVSREGDYYGRTVNVAARICDYARPREILVADRVVAESAGSGLEFDEIGHVELKGVGEPVMLYRVAGRA